MQRPSLAFTLLLLVGLTRNSAPAADAPRSTDPDFQYQGEYSGVIKNSDEETKIGVQVIALGVGKFHAVGHVGGLPGDGWDRSPKHEADGESKDGVVRFGQGENSHGEIKDGVLRILSPDGQVVGELKKVERASPTLGAKPPQGAVVLFDGTSADQFSPGKIENGLLVAGATSKRKFQSCRLHVEFLLPFMPTARGQGRGNSGCYLQGRYEVQMLDSFGLSGENNECGGIYSIKAPDMNMCFPPLSWQTYDIDYTAAKYENGKKVINGSMTVSHNGVTIHKDVELPKNTTAAPIAEGPEPGPIYLQDHGNPVRYRNIWLVEKP